MAIEAEYEEQKIQWEKEKSLLQSTIKMAEIQNSKLREELGYHKILVVEYKQENKKKKVELKEQAQLINDILKECAKERKEKERQATLHQEL